MAAITLRNLSDETHRALKARAARNSRSTEAEVRAIMEAAVTPPDRVKLGTLLAQIGRDVGGVDLEVDRGGANREPPNFFMIILDTNVVSEPLRPAPHVVVVSWLDAQPIETLFLTTITLAEVRFGMALLSAGRRSRQLHDRFERDVLPQFDGRVLSFDADASAGYATRRAQARRRGAAINDLDALIAGIAASRGFAAATRDAAPVTAVDVAVINPFGE